MNIVCVICSDLLEPSNDVYHTPCGHIFHFQCLKKWIGRSKTCPQCRDKTTERSIQRIYFNFANDDSIHQSSNPTDIVKLQSEIHSLTFKQTLAKKEINDLKEANDKLQLLTDTYKQAIKSNEETIKSKDRAILALKEQVQYYKIVCATVNEKDREIEKLKMRLEKLQSVQNILDAPAHKVDDMITTTYSDISKLQTFVSVLKRELENSIAQKRRLREKAAAKSKAIAESLQARKKLRQLEETLKNEEKEKATLQTKLLEMQITAQEHCSKCSEINVEVKCLDESKENNSVKVSTTKKTKHTSNSYNNESLIEIIEINDTIKDMDKVENTPQNIKSQGFFSMNRGIKRAHSNAIVPSILAKKPNNFMNLNQVKKKTVGSGMTFDGFGGHAKHDIFPKSNQSFHIKKTK